MKIGTYAFCFYWILFAVPVLAGDTGELDRAVKTVIRSLPSVWKIAEQKTNDIPWGHHWDENYTGPKGLLLIAKGTRPVNANFRDQNGNWHAIHVATESLEIWLMPSNYNNSHLGWLVEAPIQPTVIVKHGPIKVYARSSHLLISEQEFEKILAKYNGIEWPDSPGNNPKLLTWKDWRQKLSKAMDKEFGNR